MKKFLLGLLLSTSIFASVRPDIGLYSADYCRDNSLFCANFYLFMTDQHGRCGCIYTDDLVQPSMCAQLKCEAPKMYSEMHHPETNEIMGCECYETVMP